MNPELPHELRLKSGSSIMNYISQFSATEKTVFGILVIVAGISAIIMASKVNNFFMTVIPANGGELREGVVGLPHVANPVLAVTDVDRDISTLVYSGLMKYSNGNLVPDLAKSYNISKDGLTYSFKLRPETHFHDGNPLTTADIAFTIQKIQTVALKSPRRADWNNVSVEIVSPTEIKFVLKQPYSPFITNTTIGILPKHIWNNLTDDQFSLSEYNIKPIGSGPYKLKSLTRDSGGIPQEYHLVASSKYYGKVPYLSAITFTFFSDAEKSIIALENGVIDSLASVSAEQAKTIASDYADRLSVLSSPLPRIFGVFFNQSNNPALADKSVRQALDIAVDREAIVKAILFGYGSSIQGPLPFDTNVSSTGSDLNNATATGVKINTGIVSPIVRIPYTDSTNGNKTKINSGLAAAVAILEKAGWKKNTAGIYEKKNSKNVIRTLSFDIYTADTPDLKQAAEMVRNSWNALGAKVTVKVFESSDLYQNIIRPRKYDALLFGQLIGRDNDVYAFWHSSQRNAPGLNVALYTNGKVDTLLDTIRTTNDKAIRTAKYTDLDQLIRADIPAVFLYSPDFIYIVPKTLKDSSTDEVKVNNITTPTDRWNSIDNWYTTTQKVWKIFSPAEK